MAKFRVYGLPTDEISEREKAHRALAREVAEEGIVLLKNDGVLPLRNKNIALYGAGARMTVKGGSGSGDVNERYSVNIEQGLKNTGFSIADTLWLNRFEEKYEHDKAVWRQSVEKKVKGYGPLRTMKMFDIIHENPMPYPSVTEIQDDELSEKTNTVIYVVTRQAGEGGDRRVEKGDYLLSNVEISNIKKLANYYSTMILVINCGGIIDLSVLDEVEIGAVLFYSQGGMEGGNAFADLISGKTTPSGKLTDTWGNCYFDYPSANTFSYLSGDLSHNDYLEGIYIGYRWFEATDKKPRYPFGFGLSYTSFNFAVQDIAVDRTVVTVNITIANIGDKYAGKEVIQLYLAKPSGDIDHEQKGLVAFAKTRSLQPGVHENVKLSFDMAEQGSFDEKSSSFVLAEGEYRLLLGNSSADAKPFAVLTIAKNVTTEKLSAICPQKKPFSEHKSSAASTTYSDDLPRVSIDCAAFTTHEHSYKAPKVEIREKIARLLKNLSDDELINLCVGGGYNLKCYNNVPGAAGMTAVNLLKKGIPNIVLSDGPSGLNVLQSVSIQKSGTLRYPEGLPENWSWGWLKHFAPFVKAKPGKGRLLYHYMTAFPCETLQAQSWNTELLEEIGVAVGKEMQEIGVTIWLAPGMNLHRNPLCGRNFEYYSEDPVVTGKMAAAIIRGVQSIPGCGVSVKHFCCNNQEDNRDRMSSNLSVRTLREMYLRPFRIAINEGKPWTVMTSYNMVNDVYTPNSYDLCTNVLRNEWGFDGLVMSDWNSTDKCSHSAAINAGNDLLMPGNKRVRKAMTSALKSGDLKRERLFDSAARVLALIFNSAVADEF